MSERCERGASVSLRANRRGGSVFVVLVALLATLLPALRPAPAAAAGDYAGTLQFTVRSVTPVLATGTDTVLTVTGTMRNTGKTPVSDLSYIAQRGRPLADAAAVQAAISKPTEPTALITQRWTDLGPAGHTLAPGASAAFTLSVPLHGAALDTLDLQQPGVYPVMFNINGDLRPEGASSFHARLGELHLVLPVLTATPDGPPASGAATAVGLLWPVVDRPHIGVDGVFLDDDLAAAVAPGGRLSLVLNTLETLEPPSGSVTLVIDPELLDELDRMSRGYLVRADRSQPQSALQPGHRTATLTTSASTPPSAGPAGSATDTPASTRTGGGAQSAAEYLARLRQVAQDHPVLVLPYSDPDTVALAANGLLPQLSTTVDRGRATAAKLLPGATLITDIAYPVDGLADPATLTALSGMGYSGLLLSGAGLQGATGGSVTVSAAGHTRPALVVDTDATVGQVLEGSDPLAAADLAARLVAPGKAGSPLIIAPDRRWTPDPATLHRLTTLLATLEDAGRITALPLHAAATAGGPAATLHYPDDAAGRQLSGGDLQRVVRVQDDIVRMRAALHRDDTVKLDPAEFLDPLAAPLVTGFAAAYRDDDAPIRAVLATVQESLAGVTGQVSLVAGGQYQLASASSPLRIPVSNDLPYAVTLRVGATRSTAAVTVDPVTETIPAGRRMQVQLPTQVRQQGGAFPMQVVLRYPTADGRLWSPPVQIVVSSHAYDALTIVLLVVAGGVLALMVVWRITQRIRTRRAQGAEPRHPGTRDLVGD